MGTVEPGDTPATVDPGYALSSWEADEHARLSRQSALHEPFTRRLLERAGIDPGMRVLDVGCGPGDVSFLVSEPVGCWPTAFGAFATKPSGASP